MRAHTFCKNGFTFKRIDKRAARKAYSHGLSILLAPCNINPYYCFAPTLTINRDRCQEEGSPFDLLVNLFRYYNCGRETGYYPAFYIPVRPVDAFSGDSPTAATINTVEEYDYRYLDI